jgi:hypothetical protein
MLIIESHRIHDGSQLYTPWSVLLIAQNDGHICLRIEFTYGKRRSSEQPMRSYQATEELMTIIL